MNLELTFGNDPVHLPSVQALLTTTLKQLPLNAASAANLERLITAAIDDAVEHAYPPDVPGLIKLSCNEQHGRLEIQVRDYGLPKDVRVLEQQLHTNNLLTTEGSPDEVHWLSFGPNGKALQVVKWLHNTPVASPAVAESASISLPAAIQALRSDDDHEAPSRLAPPPSYAIRRMRPEESEQVAQLMYQTYGNSYFNVDVYYPERIAALNARGEVLSFVAVSERGEVAGHYALERNQSGPVAEGGQAVVAPTHRGHGLLNRMKHEALEEARALSLLGWYADAVTVHVLSQQANVAQGATLTAVDLAIAPKKEHFDQDAEQQQRVTCLSFFQWLAKPSHRVIYVPATHQDIVRSVYNNLDCPFDFGDGHAPQGHGQLAMKVTPGAARAAVSVDVIGEDTFHQVCHMRRECVERQALEVVYVELPLADPSTPAVATQLETDGFGFLGIAPHASQRGDVLRMAYLVEPIGRDAIHVLEDIAGELVDYVLHEQQRVRAELH